MAFWTGSSWEAEPAAPQKPGPRRVRHAVEAAAEAGMIALLAVGLIAGTAFAARTTGSLAGPVMVTDADTDGIVSYGDSVTFNVSSSAAKPYVGVRCYQGSRFVYDSYVGYFASAWFAKSFLLTSNSWAATASADCTARLFYFDSRGREKVQATKSFVVER